ncbi:MAG: Xaa-Pro aminopeptidase, partial [Sphingobacteriia bacterium 39-39-8]
MKKIIFAILLLATSQVQGQEILNLRSQAGLIDEINAERYSLLLPKLMEKEGIDMWVLISREYNEDPILKTMLPAEWLSARRRTMIVFYHD